MKTGLYEQLIDRELEDALADYADRARLRELDAADSHVALAEHLGRLLEAVLQRLPARDRLAHQISLCNRLIEVLASEDRGLDAAARRLTDPARQLLALGDEALALGRPDVPLAESGLLTGTRTDPSLLSQLKKEILAADRIDLLCSFVKWSGVQLIQDELRTFCSRPGTRMRVITTSYLGATDAPAVRLLASLPGTEVRVSYDVQRTRLHAKAYLFERDTGFGSAYIGSANLSRPALTDGLEWTVKLSEHGSPVMWQKVAGTFETYWNDPEFEPYDENQHERLVAALRREQGGARPDRSHWQPAFELKPFPFQEEILDRLAAERVAGGLHRQLVVAATGTGKTMVAAFDYRRQVAANGGRYPSLLYVAHRREILQQALASFRAVLRDQNFGDLLDGREEPAQQEHLFASVQTLHRRRLWERLEPDVYRYVVIDETHRSAAESYRGLLDRLHPEILLGLTATPERADGEDILRYFNHRVSAEIRLPDAITRRLLVPFHYYAVSDSEDYRRLSWERGGYRIAELDNLLTGNEIRAELVIRQVRERLMDPHQARGLGFCVSVAHARFMAERFERAELPSLVLSADSDREERDAAQARLRRREINFIFTVDLYNEGIDIPEVDTVLFLRPTESLTVFLQQLGRGLRLTDDKDYLTVLDFVGQMHRHFRFDRRIRALLGDPRRNVEKEIEGGFPHLPAGCSIELERVARERVLANVRQSVLRSRNHLVQDIALFRGEVGRLPTLPEFLNAHGLEVDDVYRRDSWTRLCVQAGLHADFSDPDEAALAKALRRVAHVDDALRLRAWRDWLAGTAQAESPLLLALCLMLAGRALRPESPEVVHRWLARNPVLAVELAGLLEWRASLPEGAHNRQPVATADLPLVLHASFTRDEILAAVGVWSWERRPEVREGVKHCPDVAADLLFVTLNKSERDYSPSTLYEDYAISEYLFHWQSQSTTGEASATGRRYVRHEAHGHRILLFVREDKKHNGLTLPYTYAGPVRYVRHTGSRPMSIVWRLDDPLPAWLLREWRRLAV